MKRMQITWIILAMLFSVAGCASLDGLIQTPSIDFERLEPQAISLSQGTFAFHFVASNPNPVGLNLDKITYEVEINGKPLLASQLPWSFQLPGSGSTPLVIPVSINFADLFDSLVQWADTDQVDYRVHGKAFFGFLQFSYQTAGQLDIPRLPDIRVDRIHIHQFGAAGATLRLRLAMENSNAFALSLAGLEYNLRLDDLPLASATSRRGKLLGAKGQSTMILDLDVKWRDLGQGAMALLSGGSANCRLDGNWLTQGAKGMQKVPFLFNGQVPLVR